MKSDYRTALVPFADTLPAHLPDSKRKLKDVDMVEPICSQLYADGSWKATISALDNETSVTGKLVYDPVLAAQGVQAVAKKGGSVVGTWKLDRVIRAIGYWLRRRGISVHQRLIQAERNRALSLDHEAAPAE